MLPVVANTIRNRMWVNGQEVPSGATSFRVSLLTSLQHVPEFPQSLLPVDTSTVVFLGHVTREPTSPLEQKKLYDIMYLTGQRNHIVDT
ncbi:hypothetical protein ElyMa_005481400 [Elysia marginata]|uniref:Uncharacterized protein n=1 Tax=Elysia marginata TaxID=1093978 RepID=A0AAV4ET26_9GAST|nr:hypothetical protein ElyMa_005481400 [Elysia marginata]